MIIDVANLTPQQLICPPGKRRIEYVCSSGIGLYIEVRNSSPGVGTAYLRYKDQDGVTRHVKIASTAVLSFAEIRREAKRLKAEITLGADPRAEAKARKAVITYGDLFENYVVGHLQVRLRSWRRSEQLYRLRIKPVFGNKRLNQITRHQVQSFQSALAEEGLAAATANHHVKVLRSSLNLARQWGMLEGENPAAGVRMLYEDNLVQRYLDDEELARLLAVLRPGHHAGSATCSVALFLLSTGCRLNEALSGTWDDVNIEQRVFAVRATNSKSRKLRSVPLNDSAIEVLNGLKTKERGGPLFRGRRGERLKYVAKVWGVLKRKASLPELRLHDLRHQFASFLVNDGRTLYEVQAILGHSSSKVTERYAHLSTKTLQEAANSASLKIKGEVKTSG